MGFYDSKPSKIEAIGNGSYRYRFNIKEEKVEAAAATGDEQAEAQERTQWKCDEVTVFAPLTANKITEAVIASVCPVSHEQKLVNEFNAANLGMIGDGPDSEEAETKKKAYREFLEYRAELKEQVDADCAEAGIK